MCCQPRSIEMHDGLYAADSLGIVAQAYPATVRPLQKVGSRGCIPMLSEQAFASSIAGHPGRRACQPSTHTNTATAFDARCHAYAGGQTPTSPCACPAVTARQSGDMHRFTPISVLVVCVLRVHMRLPPAKALAHDRARLHERTSSEERVQTVSTPSPLPARRVSRASPSLWPIFCASARP
jgi:hypothetical protein